MGNADLHFVAMLGSLRRDSYSRKIAECLDELAPDHVAVRDLASIGELPLYSADIEEIGIPEEVVALGDAVAAAAGVVIVTPEYNRSFPGALKNAIDWLSRLPARPWVRKAVAIAMVTTERSGGEEARHHLDAVLEAVGAVVLREPRVCVVEVAAKIEPSTGMLHDEETRRALRGQLSRLAEVSTG